ncbi:MAG: ABC transporter permease [Vulcanimicrobiaceae bacterium]
MRYLYEHADLVAWRLLQHLEIVGIALVIAFALALPLGILAARDARVRGPVLATLGVVYTLPSLAVFAALIPFFGLGLVTTEIALVAYAQMILVRNIVAGLDGVPPALREAALGLGMTPAQTFWRLDLPLALPVVIGGVRLAAVATISIATLAGKIDAGGLGALLFAGLDNDDPSRIVAGSVAAATLAIGVDALLRLAEAGASRHARWPASRTGTERS